METERVVVEDMTSLAKTVMERGGSRVLHIDVPEDIKSTANFVCRVECNDGTVIDFYARDAQAATQFPPEIRGDIKKILEKSLKDFVETVSDPDPFVSVIKGHAYIEAILTSMIEGSFLEPSELEIDRMTFSKKVKLCIAAGLIHSDVARVLVEFAKIRNGFAHQIWPSLSEKELRDFLNIFRQSKRLKMRLAGHGKQQPGVFECVWAMWSYLFEQVARITTKRMLLNEFWKYAVDAEGVALRPMVAFSSKPISLTENGE
jgi:hypothetical protein